MLSSSLSIIALCYFAFLAFKLYKALNRPASPLDIIQGPSRDSFLAGNASKKAALGPGEYYSNLVKQHGRVVLFPDSGGSNSLLLSDPKGLLAVMNDTNTFGSNELRKQMVLFMTGDSLLGHFGAVHRKQRRTIAPAFSASHLKELYPVFMKLASRLGDSIEKEVKKGGHPSFNGDKSHTSDGSCVVNVYDFTNCAALDGEF